MRQILGVDGGGFCYLCSVDINQDTHSLSQHFRSITILPLTNTESFLQIPPISDEIRILCLYFH